jgi:acetyl esterase
MPVLPELEPMLERIAAARAHQPDPSTPVAERRAAVHRGMDQRAATVAVPAPASVAVEDHRAGEIAVRVYRPSGLPAAAGCHVYVHGGGWWLGELRHRDAACGHLAAAAGCVVVSVAHRLAPEHRFPAPVHDVYAALRWAAGAPGVDRARLSIGGDSSGANLAAAAAVMARDDGGPALRAQVLEIPVLDLSAARGPVAGPVVLTPDELAADIAQYCDPGDRRHPYASPLFADPAGLPPALIMTAEYDILRDDGPRYAALLTGAGVPARVVEWPGHVHGSHEMTALLPTARAWQAEVAAYVGRCLS